MPLKPGRAGTDAGSEDDHVEEYTAPLIALLDGQYDQAEELLKSLSPSELRRLACVAQDLGHMARAASLRQYLHVDELAALGKE